MHLILTIAFDEAALSSASIPHRQNFNANPLFGLKNTSEFNLRRQQAEKIAIGDAPELWSGAACAAP
jgi:hypothetical protein